MSWLALLPAAGSLLGGLFNNEGEGDSREAYEKALAQARAEWERAHGETRGDLMPYFGAGQDGLARQSAFLNGDDSGFKNSADYKFALDQGIKTSEGQAAARGNLFGGGTQADLQIMGQGLATRNMNNYWDKITGRANMGADAARTMAGFNMGQAGSLSNMFGNTGQQMGSSYQRQGQNNSSMFGGIFGGLANAFGGSGNDNIYKGGW